VQAASANPHEAPLTSAAVAERIDVDVVVVGAGLAGLTAARQLETAGKSVVVVEARDRVGGRVHEHTFTNGPTVEVGGQWVGPTQLRINRLVTELGLETFPTYCDGEQLLDYRGTRKRFTGEVPPLNPVALADVGQSQLRFDRLAKRVPLTAPWAADLAEEWDEQTFATWVRRNTKTESARWFWETFAQAVFAAQPCDFSLLHALFYTHSGSGVASLIGTERGAQQDRIVGGPTAVAERLAQRLQAPVRLSSPVRRIAQAAEGVIVAAGSILVRAQHAIVAIPPTLAARIDYDPPLPAWRDQLTQKAPQGSVIKVNVLYDSPFWREEGLNGQAFGDRGPIRFTFDNSPPDGSSGVLVCFFEGAEARTYTRLSSDERRAAVLDSLAGYFGPRAASPVDWVELDWSAEEWTRGCYGAHFGPGVWTQFGPALSEPIGRLHWAGTETASVWAGYMDGAIQSGERAAAEVLHG
jgi:monoamine oxidase